MTAVKNVISPLSFSAILITLKNKDKYPVMNAKSRTFPCLPPSVVSFVGPGNTDQYGKYSLVGHNITAWLISERCLGKYL